jgi:outer membrane protein OmpA-like peptidoglycan-associated protein
MEQVHQRIVAASHIEGLEESETEAYVIHRLSVVGWQGNPAIDRAIFPYIHKFSEGVPRRINLICSRLFLLGSVEERQVISVADVRVVIGELQAENLAAGTGISLADFHNTSEPQWAPVPVSESLVVPTLPPLQETNTPEFVVEEIVPDQQPIEVKKKDIPRLEPLNKSVPESESGIPSVAAARFEFVAESDLENDKSVGDDMIALDDALPASNDNEHRLVTTSGGAAESVVPRKRLIGISFLAIVAIALVLLMKTCFVSSDEWAVRDMGDSAPELEADVQSSIVGGGNKLVEQAVKTKPDASRAVPRPAVSDSQQRLVPIVVAAARRPIPVAFVSTPEEVGSITSQEEVKPSDSGEAGSVDSSSPEERDQVLTEITMAQDRQETILISFPFDSDDLIPDTHLALDRAATMLRDNTTSVASITGFTDNQGDTQYNLVLSRKRASAVEQYLVGAGIARDRLRVEGRGVLTDAVEAQSAAEEGAMEPYRIVRIKLGSDG